MFGTATITLGISPHSSYYCLENVFPGNVLSGKMIARERFCPGNVCKAGQNGQGRGSIPSAKSGNIGGDGGVVVG